MSIDKSTIQNLRQDYRSASLLESDVAENPYSQFEKWFTEALNAEVLEPNAMTLATANTNGIPSARIVLLKEFTNEGFVFYTNYNSQKGKEIESNPYAALIFFWADLERQIRIEGVVEKVSEEESNQYFNSRPKGSQLGALTSPQSETINSREFLEKKLADLEKQYEDKEVIKPEHWGGYRVIPNRIEFWQGQSNRLHDRIVYIQGKDKNWKFERLAP
ncbi:MAG: pyridoxamine 5'-phosphate oxidase [Bacteroidetes bacterium]|nr:pyridoxamine 5'-phosphate oxidase [Bacteroidota bacterium]MBU1484085.1 pyridoxamine 5'-phosphate oxidase [Bacteroidota bacterium]MBU2046668.1 pyridoxamine 5'-phosphate oxidase [Bacteroidota bacterium]MBU2266722.1 pyridoxamine 5'-phosphate oxidase [Bacteroidota bacterium]MBU2375276.1 pyridoxamine 5'-phosphate oxidase [Bacteroidota bacterium]